MTGRASILLAVDPASGPPDPVTVRELALATGWRVDILHVAAPGADEGALDRARGELTAQASALAGEGVEVSVDVRIGPPVDVILLTAEELDSAMVIMAGHRHDIGSRPMMGSVTSALLKVSERPVLVIPAGAGRPEPGLVGSVDRLIELIDRHPGEVERYAELRQAAAEQLVDPTSPQARRRLHERLRDSLHRFETEHPSLTAAINDVSYHLSGMGI